MQTAAISGKRRNRGCLLAVGPDDFRVDMTMTDYLPVRIIGPVGFDRGTAQTPGSLRLAAIAPELGIEASLWGGLFEVEPGARTGIHHHGEQQTIAYVLSGVCDVRCGKSVRPGGKQHRRVIYREGPTCGTARRTRTPTR